MDMEDWPSYYSNDDFAESLDESQRRYLKTDKGKAALKRYAQSDKGKANQKRYYQKKKATQQLIELFRSWVEEHPGKTIEDFLQETANDRTV